MTDELVTIDGIVAYLKDNIENKKLLSPSVYVDASQKINVLLGDEHDLLFELQQKVAKIKIDYLEEDPKSNVSKARLMTEATDVYKEMQKQKAKISRIEEFIRIAKIQSKLKETEFKGY